MKKRTGPTVMEAPCACGSLENALNDPDTPIVFDRELNEYHIEYEIKNGGKGFLMIYYCPFCGGAAPKSQRRKLFAVIPPSEEERLYQLFNEVLTLDDAIRTF